LGLNSGNSHLSFFLIKRSINLTTKKSKPNSPVHEVTFNLVYGLLLDIIIVGLLKNAFKRRRPSGGESRGDIGPDAYSFPSGHSSRAVLISLFIQHVFRFSAFARGLIAINLLWFVLTRVWLGRHYLGDVLVGSLSGYCTFRLVCYLWMSSSQLAQMALYSSYLFTLFSST